jgi:hypothetical protein
LVLSDWRSAWVALFMFLLWPAATACSSSITPASTALVAAARCSGSMRGGRRGRRRLGRRRPRRRSAQLVGPQGHGRQRRGGILRGGHGLRQGEHEGVPHRVQLALRGLQLGRKAHVHAGPLAVGLQRGGLVLPVRHVGLQRVLLLLRLGPGLGGPQLDALRQQGRGLALHHHALLQVLDGLDALDQLRAQAGQRLARQRRAGLGGVALPGQGVGDVQARGLQQGLGLGLPFGGHGVLALGAAQLVEFFAQRLGGALVLGRQLLEHLLHLLGRGLGGQPVAHALGALARCGGGKPPPVSASSGCASGALGAGARPRRQLAGLWGRG